MHTKIKIMFIVIIVFLLFGCKSIETTTVEIIPVEIELVCRDGFGGTCYTVVTEQNGKVWIFTKTTGLVLNKVNRISVIPNDVAPVVIYKLEVLN